MRVSINWLKDYVDVEVSADELAHQLTMAGLAVESIERPGADVKGVVVGRILSIEQHPDADKLVVCKTDVGQHEPLQIICGATNMKQGDLVPTAVVGASLPGGFHITRRKMRGVESFGMMCSAHELGLAEDHTGLLILEPGAALGADVLPLLGLDDAILETDITPNRGDWASMIGVAREIAALNGTESRRSKAKFTETAPKTSEISSVTIENPDLCPRYIGRVCLDVKMGPSPQWMQRRLVAAGHRPINNIVDITNYVLLETGHPLHAFDLDKLIEHRIVVRTAKHGETIETIDGTARSLASGMLVIADAKVPVAVAGVMGGRASEVGESTSRVFLESAYFDPRSVRKTSRALEMQTEASAHFQRGADPEMAAYAIDRAASLMQELAGASITAGVLDEHPRPFTPTVVALRYARTDLLLGVAIPADEQRGILSALGFQVATTTDNSCTVSVPPWRHDVSLEADLIEEVARVHGYEKIALTIPSVKPNIQIFAPHEDTLNGLRDFLVGHGMTEFFVMTFSNPEAVRKCLLTETELDMVPLQNPLSEQATAMRTSLIPGLLSTVSNNIRHGTTDLAAFELGPVFRPNSNPGQDLPEQGTRLGIVLSGHCEPRHWGRPPQLVGFYDLKGCAEGVLEFLAARCTFEPGEFGPLQPGQCGKILFNGQTLGWLGEVRSSVLHAFDIEQPVLLLELDLEPVLDIVRKPAQFQPLPAFPPSLRDMAILVDAEAHAGVLRDAILQAGGALLKRVEIFDVYSGPQVPAGKKSIALSLVFQSDERTLTDKETQKTWDKIVKRLESEFGAELR